MARRGALDIPLQIIDPVVRNIVAITSDLQVVGYNKKLISADKVPAQWEDFLKPEFKGRKFCADIRPVVLSALVPALGDGKSLGPCSKNCCPGARLGSRIRAGPYVCGGR